jgi:VWFA-related protein
MISAHCPLWEVYEQRRARAARVVSVVNQRRARLWLATRGAVFVCTAGWLIVDPEAAAQTETRRVYVSVLDAKGAPVAGLTAADFSVKEDDRLLAVLEARRSDTPLSIALLVDDSGPGLNDIRAAISRFMNLLLYRAEFSVIATSEQNVTLTDYTSDANALAGAVSRLRARTVNGGGHLVEAIVEAAASFGKRAERRGIILVLALQGQEYGTLRASRVLEVLQQSGAALNVVDISRPTGQTGAPPGSYDRYTAAAQQSDAGESNATRGQVLSDGPRLTGGRRDELLSTTKLLDTITAIAEDIAHQYAVVYTRPAGAAAASKIAVSVKRSGVKVRAPTRVFGPSAR